MPIKASELRRRTVMSAEGRILGKLKGIVANEFTGDLTDVIVEPLEDIDTRLYQTDMDGNMVFPFEKVQSITDVVVLNVSA